MSLAINKHRIICFDTARVLAIFWICCFSHLSSYMDDSFKIFATPEIYNLTRSSLALMMLISGFFLSKYSFNNKEEIINFYYRRFIRFYPLYFISAITLYLLGFIPKFSVLILALLGLSSYILPQPPTLWFMSMLMSFYIITPILCKTINSFRNTKAALLMILIVYIGLFLVEACVNIDNRLHWCFFAYIIGLVIGRKQESYLLLNNNRLEIVILLAYTILLIFRVNGAFIYDIEIIVGAFAILYISKWISYKKAAKAIICFSYASMAMYLFHRHFFIIEKSM